MEGPRRCLSASCPPAGSAVSGAAMRARFGARPSVRKKTATGAWTRPWPKSCPTKPDFSLQAGGASMQQGEPAQQALLTYRRLLSLESPSNNWGKCSTLNFFLSMAGLAPRRGCISIHGRIIGHGQGTACQRQPAGSSQAGKARLSIRPMRKLRAVALASTTARNFREMPQQVVLGTILKTLASR